MVSAWRSDSAGDVGMVSRGAGAARLAFAGVLLAAGLAGLAREARALDLSEMEGHVSIGYAKLFADQAPGGSVSFAGGLDVPLAGDWRAGFGVGVSLLGTRNQIRGSLSATIDYSTFEALAYGHWRAPNLGPIERLSLGAGLMTARAEISSAGGGAAFLDLARDEIAPAIAIEATLMPRGPSPVRAGLELGTRIGFVEAGTWAVASARLAIYY